MSEFLTVERLTGLTLYDAVGDEVGAVAHVYRDTHSGAAEWVSVKTGLFGDAESFVPLYRARAAEGELHVPYAKELIAEAARVAGDTRLEAQEERELFAHYGLRVSAPVGVAGSAAGNSGHRPDDVAGETSGGAVAEVQPGEDEHTRSAPVGVAGAAATTGDDSRDDAHHSGSRTGEARLTRIAIAENVHTTVPANGGEAGAGRDSGV